MLLASRIPESPGLLQIAQSKAKAAKEKKEKGGSKAAPDKPAAEAELDVSLLNLQIGQIVSVKQHPNADSLYVEEIDLGRGQAQTGDLPFQKANVWKRARQSLAVTGFGPSQTSKSAMLLSQRRNEAGHGQSCA